MNERPNRLLPEILVGIMVILIVAFLATRTFKGGIAKGHQAACLNNINQLGQALRMYSDDHDQGYPLGPAWQDAVMAYVSDTPDWQPFYCPARRDDEKGWSYGLNWSVAGLDDQRLVFPSETILLVDVRNSTRDRWWANDIRFLRGRHNRPPLPIHIEKANFAYCDGHVKTLDPFRMTEGNWFPRER